MKLKIFFFALGAVIALACNDTPDAQPQNNQIVVYPNPVQSAVVIGVNNQDLKSFTVQVFDARGNIFLKDTGNEAVKQYNLDMHDKPKGEYHVDLEIGKSKVTKTFVKV